MSRAAVEGASADPDTAAALASFRPPGWYGSSAHYWRTRNVFLRGLGALYGASFLSLALQWPGLIGSAGISPVERWLRITRQALEGNVWWRLPSLFLVDGSDVSLGLAAWLGVALSLVLMAGLTNMPALAALWLLQLSFVHVGQEFLAYGWETLLLEMGFLAIFLAPPWDPRRRGWLRWEPPVLVFWLLRWTLFRLYFGAGLIKVRGDPCWTELTCLDFHYETQPLPNPVAYYLHFAPAWTHRVAVVVNHFVELIVPWGFFGPRRLRYGAAACAGAFQLLLIVSGNLSFFNWLTLVLVVAVVDDGALRGRFRRVARSSDDASPGDGTPVTPDPAPRPGRARQVTLVALGILVGLLSINPILNLLADRQRMNASYEPLHLVNSYGAFGSVERERLVVVLQGTNDAEPGSNTRWREYVLPCAPGPLDRAPCVLGPYQLRLDWQFWFLQFGRPERHPWFLHVMAGLLQGNASMGALFERVPFPDGPRWLRARLYRYRFASPMAATRDWWQRKDLGDYVRPMRVDDPTLRRFLRSHGYRGGAPRASPPRGTASAETHERQRGNLPR